MSWLEPHEQKVTSIRSAWPGDEFWGVSAVLTQHSPGGAWALRLTVADVGELTYQAGFDLEGAKAHAEKVVGALVALRKPNAQGGLK